MKVRVCSACKKPYMDSDGYCPRCPSAHNLNADSLGHLGCMILMTLPVLIAVLFWLFLLIAFVGR